MDKTLKNVALSLLLILAALISCLFVADKAAAPETYASYTASIDNKTETVLKLTALSTLASAGVSAIPGDTATPIAEKLADFSEYFLLILCVLYSEKYLLSLIGAGTFRYLVPILCALGIVGCFWNPRLMKRLAGKLAGITLALLLIIPLSIRASDMIYSAFSQSIDGTIAAAEQLTDETAELSEAGEDTGKITSILNRLSETADSLIKKASNILNRFVETLAVMIVTSCIIPTLVLLFFLWLIKQMTGVDPAAFLPRRGERDR